MEQLVCISYIKIFLLDAKICFTYDPVKLVPKHFKFPKYYRQDCLNKFLLHFLYLVMIRISEHSSISTQKKYLKKTH